MWNAWFLTYKRSLEKVNVSRITFFILNYNVVHRELAEEVGSIYVIRGHRGGIWHGGQGRNGKNVKLEGSKEAGRTGNRRYG